MCLVVLSPTARPGLGSAASKAGILAAGRGWSSCKKRVGRYRSDVFEHLLTVDRRVAAGDEVSWRPGLSVLRLGSALSDRGFKRDIVHRLLLAAVQLTQLDIENGRQLRHLLRIDGGVHVLKPVDAAYLFREATRDVGSLCNHVALGPREVRCSDVHGMEPEGQRNHRSVPNMTVGLFTPGCNHGVLLLGWRERAREEPCDVSKWRLKQ